MYEVIIPAAGEGKRMQAEGNKLFIALQGKAIITHTLQVFNDDPTCQKVILSINPLERSLFERIIKRASFKRKIVFVEGGSERQYSVHNGLHSLSDSAEIALVHDGARPFINHAQIRSLVSDAKTHGATVLAVPVKDTIKKVVDLQVDTTIERAGLWAVQTPQAFRVSLLKEAHGKAKQTNFLGTDDASLVERIGKTVSITKGNYDNIKITTPEDLYFAEAILRKQMDFR